MSNESIILDYYLLYKMPNSLLKEHLKLQIVIICVDYKSHSLKTLHSEIAETSTLSAK